MSTVAFPIKSSLGDVWPCDRKSRRLGLANDGAVHITPTRQNTCLPAATTVSVRTVCTNRPNFRDRSFHSTTINYRGWGEPESFARVTNIAFSFADSEKHRQCLFNETQPWDIARRTMYRDLRVLRARVEIEREPSARNRWLMEQWIWDDRGNTATAFVISRTSGSHATGCVYIREIDETNWNWRLLGYCTLPRMFPFHHSCATVNLHWAIIVKNNSRTKK